MDGDRPSLARALSLVERGGPDARIVAASAHQRGGTSYTLGITGAPGAGKSTLTTALVARLRQQGDQVAVLAIDPSSPFTGGAILGDRVRMGEHALDDGVFIRSMATRGHLGGLALAAPEAIRVLDAAGFAWVILETVGVGQVEVEVAGTADTTVVVVNPGWGDAVQANKAGLMEIADVFVINKADREGTGATRRDLEGMLDLSGDLSGETHGQGPAGGWRPPVVETVATTGAGVDDLVAAVSSHRNHLEATGALAARRAARVTEELHRIIAERLRQQAAALGTGEAFTVARDRVLTREVDPWTATDALVGDNGPVPDGPGPPR
jgi:LAO/AO transport system kinase